jgi:hypothetical protein
MILTSRAVAEVDMLSHTHPKHKPRVFYRLTGLTLNASAQLRPAVGCACERALAERDRRRQPSCQERHGMGRKVILTSREDKSVFVLFSFACI